ncbi:MAG: GNAT family N-acetyltransferase [Dehalococcoidia bacterium]
MNQKIVVRNIQPGEDKAVWKVAKTLSIVERYASYLLFYLAYKIGKAKALVAVDGERIVGCVIAKVTTLAGEKIGIVDLIFVDRNVQGRGVGKALVDAALSHFEEAECQTLYYIVDRFNSPSWNMAWHRGLDLFEFNEQLRVFGWKILSLWLATGYFFAPGTFILRKTGKESQMAREAGAGWHFLLAWLGFSFVLWAVGIRLDAPWLNSIPFVLGVVGVSIFTHELSHKLVGHSLGFKTIFKVWESGLPFSAFWALLGGLLPFYGSTFIRQKDWAYNKDVKKMGLIYMAGPVVSLVLASCFLALAHWANTEWLVALGTVGFRANFVLVLFNLIPIFPFACFDGRRIFLWNKIVWSLLVIWFALLLGAIIFL